jgi:AraC family transcriptional regulator
MTSRGCDMNNIIKPQELPEWVPGILLSSSENLGWEGISHRSYHYSGQDVPIPPIDHYMIVKYTNAHTPMQRCFDGKWTKRTCSSGDISLLTSLSDSHWHWTQEIEVSHVYITNELMSKVACEVLDRPIKDVLLHDELQLHDPVLLNLVDSVQNEAAAGNMGGSLYAESLAIQLAVHLLRNYANIIVKECSLANLLSNHQKRLLVDYINSHIHVKFRVEDLANLLGMGLWTFTKKFSESFSCTPHSFITSLRVEKAKKMLTEGNYAIKEVAYDCGFSDQAHLTRVVRASLGVTPGQLRRSA